MRRSEARWAEIRVGLFVAMIVALAFGAAVYVGMAGSPLEDTVDFHVRAPSGASGFSRGSPVEMGGVVVGEVTRVHAPTVKERVTVLDVRVSRDSFQHLGVESRAELQARSLFGQKFMTLSPRPEGTPPLDPGGSIEAVPTADLEALARTVSAALQDARRLMASLAATGDAVSDLVAGVQGGQGTLGKLVQDDELYRDLSKGADQFSSLMGGLMRGEGALGTLLTDEEAARRLDRALQSLAAGASALERLIEDIRRNPQRYVQVKVF